MDTGEVKDFPSAEEVRAFFRRETFYVLIVLFVAVMGLVNVVASFKAEDSAGRVAVPIEQGRLMASYNEVLNELRKEDPAAAAFPEFVEGLKVWVLLAGSATILILGVIWVRRGGLLRKQGHGVSLPPWGLWDALKLGALFTVGVALLRGIFPINLANPFASSGGWLAHLFARALLVGVMIHIVVVERGGRLGDLGLRWKRFGYGIAVGALGFLALRPVLYGLEFLQLRLIPRLPVQEPLQGILRARLPTTIVLAAFVAVLVAPVAEEMFFRAFIQPALQRWVGRTPGILVGAAFFAAGHMDIYNLAPLFLLGVVLGYLYDRTGSLAAPITLHVAHNGMTILAIMAYRSVFSAAGG